MSQVTDTLTAKVGGVPTWVYGIGAGALVLGVMSLRDRRKPAAKAPDTAATDTAAAVAAAFPVASYMSDEATLSPSPMGSGTWAVAPRSGSDTLDDPAPNVAPGIRDNAQWSRLAIDWLVGIGFNPLVASNGIGKALNGETLTPEEGSVVMAALRQFGAPPDGMPAVRIQRDPTAPGTPGPGPSTPPTSPAKWTPPSYLVPGKSFVKADGGSTATYLVKSNGIEWIPSYEAYKRLGGFRTDAEALAAPVVIPAAVMRTWPRLGASPPPETDASLR